MNKPFLYVANWKMYLTHQATVQFCNQYVNHLDILSKKTNSQIVLCPSFTSLAAVATLCKSTTIAVGAQNCSEHVPGAYTGQVSAADLAGIGCSYCIIGHSEARTLLHESPRDVAAKIPHLLAHTITPIICIGETKEEYKADATLKALQQQLLPIIELLKTQSAGPYLIAYEPVWAIGTSIAAAPTEVDIIARWIQTFLSDHQVPLPDRILYGGSVTPEHAAQWKELDHICGLLIGGASLDFQKFEKIVS